MRASSTILPSESDTLIDTLLAGQRSLTAAANFARWHEAHEPAARATHYRDLLPLAAPRPGQQYAFEVDLDRCSGCKACVTACHALNGLDDDETWRSVGLLVGQANSQAEGKMGKVEEGPFSSAPFPLSSSSPFQQHVTTACHHCIDPACLNGCPVLAYEKDPVTGIVRHLDDQCIGCQYCVMMCPYDVPKYSQRLGIVRKCDLCSDRLAEGEAPACAQACPNEAIRITLVEVRAITSKYRRGTGENEQRGADESPFTFFPSANLFLPASPDPAYTLPTTRYFSANSIPADLVAANEADIGVQPSHMPLVWMLVLTQCASGSFAVLPFTAATAQPLLAGIAVATGSLGLVGGFLHLGKPLKAWRSFLGLRRSWLSREIVVFSVFMVLATLLTTELLVTNTATRSLGILVPLAASSGLLGVFCSGMVYHDTRRDFWRGELSIGKFFGTAAVLGLATAWFAGETAGVKTAWVPGALVVISLVRLAREFALLRRCPDDADIADELPSLTLALARSAMLLRFRLGLLLRGHIAAAWVGGVVLPAIGLLVSTREPWLAGSAAVLCSMSEFAERLLFFRAVVPLKMPGGVAA